MQRAPRGGGYGVASDGSLECLDELRKLVLVAEDDLESARPDPHLTARHPRGGDTRPLREGWIDGRHRTRTPPRTRRLRGALGSPNREPVANDAPRKPPPRVVIRNREHRPRVPLGQLAAGDHPQHLVGKLEQPEPVRDGRLRPAHALRDLAERESELIEEDGVGARLLHSRQLLAGHVLDKREQERVPVVRLADKRGDAPDPRLLRRPPAPLAGDQLVAAGGPRPDDDRLQEALRLDRARQAVRRLRQEPPARLARVGVDRLERELGERRRRVAEAADQDVEPAPETTAGPPL